MKRISIFICLMAFASMLSACGRPNSLFVKACDRAANVTIGPEYEDYVNKDISLDDVDKEIRLRTLQAWRESVKEAKDGSGEK
jgi:hypothetical protein